MGGVYGEFLGFFAELFEDFKIYKQSPKVTSGYKLEYSRTVRGIRQSISQSVLEKNLKAKTQLQIMDIGESYSLWTYEKIDPATEFVEIDGRMFRPISSSVFSREGGFWEMKVEMLVGNDGRKNNNADLAEGTF